MDINEAVLLHEGFYFVPDYSGMMDEEDYWNIFKTFQIEIEVIKNLIKPTRTVERLIEKYWLFGGMQ